MNITMQIKSFDFAYDLVEFNYYVSCIDNNSHTQIVDLLFNNSLSEFREEDFNSLFIVEIDNQAIVFSEYKVDEFYEQNGLLKVICIKQ